jgi:hypothetical protein
VSLPKYLSTSNDLTSRTGIADIAPIMAYRKTTSNKAVVEGGLCLTGRNGGSSNFSSGNLRTTTAGVSVRLLRTFATTRRLPESSLRPTLEIA